MKSKKIIGIILVSLLIITLLINIIHSFSSHELNNIGYHTPILAGEHDHEGVVVEPPEPFINEKWVVQVLPKNGQPPRKEYVSIRNDVPETEFSFGDTLDFKHGFFRPKIRPNKYTVRRR